MKILLVITNSDLAGAPVHLRGLAKSLVDRGHDIRVVFGQYGPVADELGQLGIDIDIVPGLQSKITPFKDLFIIYTLRKIIKRYKPDIVHCHSTKAGLVSRLSSTFLSCKIVYTIHGWGFGSGRNLFRSIMIFLIELFLTKLTTHYIAVSDFDRRLGLKFLALKNKKITTIYNGVKYKSTHTNKDGKISVIMVARNDPQKDYLTFFKTVANINIDNIFVVGRGTDTEAFKRLARDTVGDNYDKIRFMGEQSDIISLLAMSSVFILCSNFEGLPISIIEAMSVGLPIVASDVGGVSELVDHEENGFLCARGDYKCMHHYVNKILLDENLRSSLGHQSSINFHRSFDHEKMVDQTLLVYQLALAEINC